MTILEVKESGNLLRVKYLEQCLEISNRISADWGGLPGNIDTAITWKDTGATYIFKVIRENHDYDNDEEDCGNSHEQSDH